MKHMLAMQASVCFFAVMVQACSLAVEAPALPPTEYADTEVSTNFTFAIANSGGCRLVFSLELEASPSKN